MITQGILDQCGCIRQRMRIGRIEVRTWDDLQDTGVMLVVILPLAARLVSCSCSSGFAQRQCLTI
jgi:hypothetical protein